MAASGTSPIPMSKTPSATRTRDLRPNGPLRLLAVDPGTRYLGLAAFEGPELIRAEIETVRTPGMNGRAVAERAEAIVLAWIMRYEPDRIAVEECYFAQARRSRSLRRVTQAVIRAAKRRGLPVILRTPLAVRRRICLAGPPTRLAVAHVIATERFPWLQPLYEKEARRSWWRKRYWTSLFDAVALGLTALPPSTTRPPHDR